MSSNQPYRKYMVYFFLYLAVICELLIVIVERDDAEAELLKEKLELKHKNEMIIKELLKNQPVVSAASDNALEVGEVRNFVVGVKGLGEKDDVIAPPVVYVFKGINPDLSDTNSAGKIYPEPLSTSTGNRLYSFEWKGSTPGFYTFSVKAGTNRIATIAMDGETLIKVGSLSFSSEEIDAVILKDAELKAMLEAKGFNVKKALAEGVSLSQGFISQSANLDPANFMVEVIHNPPTDQLKVFSTNVVTAVNFPYTTRLRVEGSNHSKVTKVSSSLGLTTKDSIWNWEYKSNKEGVEVVKLEAYDNRGGGNLSKSISQFKVTTKMPVISGADNLPYSGEMFMREVKVAGLEDHNAYDWKVLLDGDVVAKGSGTLVKYDIPENAVGKELVVKATYLDKEYPIYLEEDSKFAEKGWTTSSMKYTVLSPYVRTANESWKNGGEYVISNVFSFRTYTCGRCILENMIPNKDNIYISVVDDFGKELLDDFTLVPLMDTDGRVYGHSVEFYLKGKVPKDGVSAVIEVKIGSMKDRAEVFIVPDGFYN